MNRYSVAPSRDAAVRPRATIDGEVQAGGSASFISRITRRRNVGTEFISAPAPGSLGQHEHWRRVEPRDLSIRDGPPLRSHLFCEPVDRQLDAKFIRNVALPARQQPASERQVGAAV